MPYTLGAMAILGGRVVAGGMAFIFFYMAFFLYPNEQGLWTNRILQVWAAIDDRAKFTGSNATAVFNKTAELVEKLFTLLFGTRLFSLRSATCSINLSTFSMYFLSMVYVYYVAFRDHMAHLPILYFRGLASLFLIAAPLVIPRLVKKKWAEAISLLPTVGIICFLISQTTEASINADPSGSDHTVWGWRVIFFLGLSGIIMVSWLSDILSVAAIRKTLAFVARSASMSRILLAAFYLLCLMCFFEGLPAALSRWIGQNHSDYDNISFVLLMVALFNIATVLYCIVPILLLALILLDRLLWPLLGRVIYPLCQYDLLGNRKLLITLAVVLSFIAFNIEKLGFRELLKLLV